MAEKKDLKRTLSSFNKWQHFMTCCTIVIQGTLLSAFDIEHSILRSDLEQPKVSRFMLSRIKLEEPFQIHNPHPLLCFGVFLPIR